MTGSFSPSSLFFLKSGGTQTITFTASSPTTGEYSGFRAVSQGLYHTNITGRFIERSTSGCTIEITASPSTGTTNEQYLCSFYVGDGQTLVKQEFGLEIINVPDTFTPPSYTIIFPNSGGTQTVRCETEDAVDIWQIVGISPNFSIMRIDNIVTASTYVDFNINILENDLAGAQGEIRVQKTVNNTPLSNMYYFTIGDFTVSPVSPATFDFTGGTKTINCVANFGTGLEFSVVNNIDWVDISVDNSSNRNATITINADNNTGIARSGNIVIKYGSLTQSYGIQQAAYVEPSKNVTITPSSLTFDHTGGTQTITCSADYGDGLTYSVINNTNWANAVVNNSSNRNATISLTAQFNTGIERSGNIVIKYGNDFSQTYYFNQAEYVEPSGDVTITPKSPLTFDHTGGTKTINCSADYGDGMQDFSVVDNIDWLTCSVDNSEDRKGIITVSATTNTGITRSGNIVIKYGNNFETSYGIQQSAYVEPSGNVTITPDSLSFDHTGGTKTIQCVADYGDGMQEFSISGSISWADVSIENTSDRNATITVVANNNTGIARSGNIVIKYGNNFEESYGIFQDAYVEPSGNVNITPDSLTFEDTGGTQTITCVADYGDGLQDFSVEHNIDWATISVENTEDRKGVITVIAKPNTGIARSGNIIIKYGNNFSQSYGIFQNAKKNVTITPSSLTFDHTGGTQNINCSANYGSGLTYSVSEDIDWLTCSIKNTSDRNATISVTSTKNTGNQRSANITISYGNDFSKVYTITQSAYVEPTGNVTITPDSLSFDHTGGTKTIKCVADYGDGLQDFAVSGSIDWVKNINVDNTSNRNATITIVVDDWNLASSARTGNFTIKYGNNFSKVYTITQKKYTEPTGNVDITPASPLKFDHTGGTKTIECVADYGDGMQEFSINGSISWADISIENTSDRNATITVNTQFNTGIARSGNIVIKYGNNFEKSYGIQQSAYVEPTGNVTITPKSPLKFKSSGGTQTITCIADYGDGLQDFSVEHSIDWADISVDNSTDRKGIITVIAEKNLSTARSGNIIIKYGKNFEESYGIQQDRNIPGSIVADPDSINAVFAEISGTCTLTIVNTSGITATSSSDWVTCSISKNKLIYNISENTTNRNREATITIQGIDINLNKPVVETVSIFQSYYNIYAICQDTEFKYDTSYNYLTYTINDGDNVVYSGRAYKLPNSASVIFNVNKLVSDYVNSELPNEFPSDNLCKLYTLDNYYKNFIIKNSLGNELGSFNFFNDWSYNFNRVDQRLDANGYVKISDPIRKVISRNQYFLYSVFLPYQLSNVDYNINYKLENDKSQNVNRITQSLDKSTQYLIIDNTLQNYPNYNKINVNGDTFEIVDNCYEYVLYYQNAYGGWDSLLVQGNTIKSDSITSYSYSKAFNNTTIEFEKKKYTNVIQTKYQMYTDYLTDAESSKMHHLFESCEIYLHNLFTNQIMPVNITDSSFDYKTYKNQGKKLYYYTFNLEVAQEKLRK